MPGLSRITKLQLRALGRMPMAKPMIENVFISMKVASAKFKEEHGRDPEGGELAPILRAGMASMALGLLPSKPKQGGGAKEPESK